MNRIEVFECNAEAIICGESYDVKIVSGPDEEGICLVDVPFEDGEFVERIGILKSNIFPLNENAIQELMN